MFMIILWPFWMLFTRFQSAWKSAASPPQTKFNIKKEMDEDLNASARAQIIEVAIESSFQPILQLYLLLPVILMQTSCPLEDFLKLLSITDVYSDAYRIQFWSIVTSIISLSWSFTFYQSIQKKGALNFASNFSGRMTVFIANLLQITSRLFALIIYAYTFRDGNFWPMILTVVVHILLMSFLHYLTSDEWVLDDFNGKRLKICYHCLINGICNLYLHNYIIQISSTSQGGRCGLKVRGTSFRQILFDTIFVFENLVIVLLGYFELGDELPFGLFSFVLLSQYFGIMLKIFYYYKFHIWRNTFSWKETKKNIQESSNICCMKITPSNNEEDPNTTKSSPNIEEKELGDESNGNDPQDTSNCRVMEVKASCNLENEELDKQDLLTTKTTEYTLKMSINDKNDH